MSRQEFIDELKVSLSGLESKSQINENIRYYDNYIKEQVASGKSEAEVLKDLGDPRLIAKTILASEPVGQEAFYGGQDEYAYTREDNTPENTTIHVDDENGSYTFRYESGRNVGWKTKAKFYITIAVIVLVIAFILIAVTKLFIWMLPAIVVIALVGWIFKHLNG